MALGVQFARDLYEQSDTLLQTNRPVPRSPPKGRKDRRSRCLASPVQAEQIHAALENARLDVEKAQLMLAREMGTCIHGTLATDRTV